MADSMNLEATISITADTSGADAAIAALERVSQAASQANAASSGSGGAAQGAAQQAQEVSAALQEQVPAIQSATKATNTQTQAAQANADAAQTQTQAVEKSAAASQKQAESVKGTTAATQAQAQASAQAAGQQAQASAAATKAQAEYVSSVKAGGTTLQNWGRTLTKAVTLPIVAAGIASGKAAIDFETAFTGVTKTVDGSDAQMAALRQSILDMSTSMPFAATEIAGVAQAAGQLGIKTGDIESFTRTMLQLGTATDDLDARTAATTIAQFAAVTGMSVADSDRLAASIVALGNNYPTTEGKIASMSQRLAAAGRQTGMTAAQTLGFAAALSSVGVEAEMGGSAFSKMLLEIDAAVASGGDELAAFAKASGKTSDAFKKDWERDAAGAMMTFLSGLSRVEETGGNLSQTLGDLGVTEVRQRDTMMRLAGAVGQTGSALKSSEQAWADNIALQKEYAKYAETTQSQMQMTMGKLTAAGINIGEGLLPALDSVMGAVGGIAKGFADMDAGLRNTLIFGGGALAAIGPLMNGLGGLAKTVVDLPTTMANVGSALGMIGGALSNPAFLATAGVVAGLTAIGIAMANIKTGAEQLQDAFNGLTFDEGKIQQWQKDLTLAPMELKQDVSIILDINQQSADIKAQIDKAFADGKVTNGEVKEIKQSVSVLVDAAIDTANADGKITEAESRLLGELADLQKNFNEVLANLPSLTGSEAEAAVAEAESLLERIEGVFQQLSVLNTKAEQESAAALNKINLGVGSEKDVKPAVLGIKSEYELNKEDLKADYEEKRDELEKELNTLAEQGDAAGAKKVAMKLGELEIEFESGNEGLEDGYRRKIADLFDKLGPIFGEGATDALKKFSESYDKVAFAQAFKDMLDGVNLNDLDADQIKSIFTPEVLEKVFGFTPEEIENFNLVPESMALMLAGQLNGEIDKLKEQLAGDLAGLSENPLIELFKGIFSPGEIEKMLQEMDPESIGGKLFAAILKSFDAGDGEIGNNLRQKVSETFGSEPLELTPGQVTVNAEGAQLVVGGLEGQSIPVSGGISIQPGTILIDSSGTQITFGEDGEWHVPDGGTVTVTPGEVLVTTEGVSIVMGSDGNFYAVSIPAITVTPEGVTVTMPQDSDLLAAKDQIAAHFDGKGIPVAIEVDLTAGKITVTPGEGVTAEQVQAQLANLFAGNTNTTLPPIDVTQPVNPKITLGGETPVDKQIEELVDLPEELPPKQVNQPVSVKYVPAGGNGNLSISEGTKVTQVAGAYGAGFTSDGGEGANMLPAIAMTQPVMVNQTLAEGSPDTSAIDEAVASSVTALETGDNSADVPVTVTLSGEPDSSVVEESIASAVAALESSEQSAEAPVAVTLTATMDASAAQTEVSSAVSELEAGEDATKPVTVTLAVTVNEGNSSAVQAAIQALAAPETVTKTVTVNIKEVAGSASKSSGGSSSGSSSKSSGGGGSGNVSLASAPLALTQIAPEPITFARTLAGLDSLLTSGVQTADALAWDAGASLMKSIAALDFTPNLAGVMSVVGSVSASNTGGGQARDEDGASGSGDDARGAFVQNVTINAPRQLSPAQTARELAKVGRALAFR